MVEIRRHHVTIDHLHDDPCVYVLTIQLANLKKNESNFPLRTFGIINEEQSNISNTRDRVQ